MNWDDLLDEPGSSVVLLSNSAHLQERMFVRKGKDVCDETRAFSTQLTLSDFQALIKIWHRDVMSAESNMGLLVHKMRCRNDLLPPETAEVPRYSETSLAIRPPF